jgi:hypothetical protein
MNFEIEKQGYLAGDITPAYASEMACLHCGEYSPTVKFLYCAKCKEMPWYKATERMRLNDSGNCSHYKMTKAERKAMTDSIGVALDSLPVRVREGVESAIPSIAYAARNRVSLIEGKPGKRFNRWLKHLKKNQLTLRWLITIQQNNFFQRECLRRAKGENNG